TTNSPLISDSHCVLAANCQRYEDNSRSLPSSTEKPMSLDQPPTVATVAATSFPSGDHDGPVKKAGENFSGSFLTAKSRWSLPSMLAITSELSPWFGELPRMRTKRLPSGEKLIGASILSNTFTGVP